MRKWDDLEGIDLPEWARFVATDPYGLQLCCSEPHTNYIEILREL